MDSTDKKKAFEIRLKKFAINCANTAISLPATEINKIYGRQLIRSSSSIGANYAEASCALTRKDFAHDMNKSRKESKESSYWIDLLIDINPLVSNLKVLLIESDELVKIFQKSAITLRKK